MGLISKEMKNKILFIFLMSACMLTGCFKKTVKGADGTVYEDYHECLAVQDFEAAHKFIEIMMKDVLSITDETKQQAAVAACLDARDEVLDQEARFLLSQGDESSKKRILYLLQEGESSPIDHLVSPFGNIDASETRNFYRTYKLIDLAIANDDDEFLKTLAKQAPKSYDHVGKIVRFLAEKESEENKKFIISYLIANNDKLWLGDPAALISLLKLHDIPFSDIPYLKEYEDRKQSEKK